MRWSGDWLQRFRPRPGRAILASPWSLASILTAILGVCLWFVTHPAAAPPPAPQTVSPTQDSGLATPVEPLAPVDVRTAHRALTSGEAAEYLGDGACGKCHRKAAKEHAGGRHQRTLRAVVAGAEGPFFRSKQVVRDEVRGIAYQTELAEGRGLIKAASGSRRAELAADYVMGSGRNAMTFFAALDPNNFMKLRLSYYTQAKRWNFTPTELPTDPVPTPMGAVESGRFLESCLLCHVTVLRKDLGQLNVSGSRLGIGCERCHGPGKPHVEQIRLTGRDAQIERLRQASPARINQICGACHRTSENASLADPAHRRNLPRFQGLALEQSACYQKSGALSCVTCHAPHRDSDPVLSHTDVTCRSCHSPGSAKHQTLCPVNQKSGCTNCHMPAQRVTSIPHVTYRNHWIKVWRQSAANAPKPEPPRSPGGRLAAAAVLSSDTHAGARKPQ